MNLQFVRQAIYQQKNSGVASEQPLAATEQEAWVAGAALPSPEKSSAQDKPAEVGPHRLGYTYVDDDSLDVNPTALLTTGGVEFRISPLVDSRESRLEERKALEEFHGLQSEARVVIVPEAVVSERKASPSPPPKRARASIRILKTRVNEETPLASSMARQNKAQPALLPAYESSDSDD